MSSWMGEVVLKGRPDCKNTSQPLTPHLTQLTVRCVLANKLFHTILFTNAINSFIVISFNIERRWCYQSKKFWFSGQLLNVSKKFVGGYTRAPCAVKKILPRVNQATDSIPHKDKHAWNNYIKNKNLHSDTCIHQSSKGYSQCTIFSQLNAMGIYLKFGLVDQVFIWNWC